MTNAALKNPIMLDWATEQLNKDREEKIANITDIFEALKPWLNVDLYNHIQKAKQKEEDKIKRLAKVDDVKDVEVINMFDVLMKNLSKKQKTEEN